MFKKCPCGQEKCSCRQDFGLFLIRLSLALVFIIHGWVKFTNMEATVGFFVQLGIPGFFAYIVAAVEFFGGLAMLLGVGTFYAGILLAVVMVVAILKVKLKSGFVGGYEFDITLLLTALGIAKTGPGCISIKKFFTGKKEDKAENKTTEQFPK